MAAQDESRPAPIAIVGMSCRLSGNVSTLDDFWTLVSRGRDGWSPIPEDRYSREAFYHPDPYKMGCFNQDGAYFMTQDLACFDAPFFRITKQEAAAMDPQQRLLLECTYEAFENAGIPNRVIAGTNTGVFIGGAISQYRTGTLRDVQQVPMYECTGNHQAIQAGRISHFFDLRGPCLFVDTACSSGLHAVHAAVQSIRCGEADSAVVAGASLHVQPHDYVSMSMMGLLNGQGKTFAFDHRATSGFARGEGVGCLILKPLDQALRDNDPIRSVIVNTGIGQDGKTVGLLAPSGRAQEKLMRDVYARANISPSDTGFVEAHGTGTKVGDPIEAAAIHRFFGSGRTKRAPLFVGSAKTNFGHLENASGIISIIKSSLMLERSFILPNAGSCFEKANKEIPLGEWNMKVPTSSRPWPPDKRFVSVNNFGFGGSNSHAVLERYLVSEPETPRKERESGKNDDTGRLVVLSADSVDAARRVAKQVGIFIERNPELYQKALLLDMAYTLGERRTHHGWRIAVTATSCSDLASSLNSVEPILASQAPVLAFVYTGQGAQWPRMGLELMESHSVFADTVKAAAAHLDSLGADFSLLEELAKTKDESRVAEAHISQPICTAVQLGLTALLSSWGVRPSMVTGHSSGEIAAAYAGGALTLEDAMTVAYHRGQLASKIRVKFPKLRGAMLAVGAGPSEVREIIDALCLSRITIACENSPDSVTVSGDRDVVDQLAAELENRGLFNRRLHVDVAYHSAHMQLLADDYMASIEHVAPNATCTGGVEFYSSLLGRKLESSDRLGPSYWVGNLTKPVLFSSALRELCVNAKPDIIVEIGPHSALEGPVKQTLRGIGQPAASEVKYLPSLVRHQHASIAAIKLAGSLFAHGHDVDLGQVNQTGVPGGHRPQVITSFAPYPWSKEKFWLEPRASKEHRIKPSGRHDLLGVLDDTCGDTELIWRNVITVSAVPWLKAHRMQSLSTFPLAGYLCMAVEAASQRSRLRGIEPDQIAGFRLREVLASKALILDDETQYEMRLCLRSYAEGTRSYSGDWDEFSISSWISSRGWLEHCRGLIGVKKQSRANAVSSVQLTTATTRRQRAMDPAGQELSLESFYDELEGHGAGYSSVFLTRPDSGLRVHGEYSACNVVVPDTAPTMPSLHETPSLAPAAFLDLMIQQVFAPLGAGRGKLTSLFMPSAIGEVEISRALPNRPGDKVQVVTHGRPDFSDPRPVDFFIDVWHPAQPEPVVKFTGLRVTPVNDDMDRDQGPRPLCYRIQWEPLDPAPKPVKASNGEVDAPGEEVNGHGGANGHDGANGRGRGEANHLGLANGTNGTEAAESQNAIHGATEARLDDSPVVIITDRDRSDALVSALTSLVELRTGSEPSVSSLPHLEVSASKRYICLSELDAPLLYDMSAQTFAQVQKLLLTCSSILWVTSGAYRFPERPANNINQGLLRTVRSELGKAAASLDLDPNSRLEAPDLAQLILRSMGASLASTSENSAVEYEFAEQDGRLMVPRVVEQQDMNLAISRETQPSTPYLQDFEQPGRRLKMCVKSLGALDSLYWKDEPEIPLAAEEIELKVACTGMNFKDVVIAMGQVASPYLGVECSGTVTRIGCDVSSLRVGDRVCAMSRGAYSTYARCPATSAAAIPDRLSFEEAASIPVVFCTAYYGICDLARLEAGEKILIHAASGGVGQAAIQLAHAIGAEVYATVGSAEKKKLLTQTYGIPEDHVFYSRDSDFGPAVREATLGHGVDVVINSLAGDLLRETWACLAPFGRFIEIGKRDINSNTRLEMAKFEQNCTFSSVDLTLVAAARPKIMGRTLGAVMAMLAKRELKPIEPVTGVGLAEVETALRKLQSGHTSGKVVVNHQGAGQVKATHPTAAPNRLPGHATYVIIGGTGGLGLSIAGRLVQRGARHLVLLSRSGKVSAELEQLAQQGRAVGAVIHVKRCDVGDERSVTALVGELQRTLPPIRGAIHAAMVLRDGLFEKSTFEDYDAVVRSKVSGAWNMHNALGNCPLDFFIMLSSVAAIVGNRGQAAYAAANTFLDALVRHRLSRGLAASSLNLTAVADAGYLADSSERQSQVLRTLSGSAMKASEVLALVEAAMSGQVGASCDGQCITGLDFADAASLPYYASDGKFSRLREAVLARAAADGSAASAELTVGQRLRGAATAAEARNAVADGLRDKLGVILMRPVPAKAQATTSVAALGLDSLNAIELRNWIGRELQAHLQVLELLTSGSLDDLAGLILRKTSMSGVWTT
ncbi:hypothetical protein CDD83_6687 [Cordyceps sp. RAO-2017]|nr:hypothetical protein CDD83_6687 [Cordyceps sp. RAO-2017]